MTIWPLRLRPELSVIVTLSISGGRGFPVSVKNLISEGMKIWRIEESDITVRAKMMDARHPCYLLL